jgi:RNA polymerase sigma-70 factor (ECF subfamily)
VTGAARHEVDLERLLQGDRQEFGKMVQAESPRLFRVMARMLGDEDEAESVMQEAFLQAYRRLETFRGEASFTTWLYAIAINLARASLRSRKRLSTYAEEDIERMQPAFVDGAYTESFEAWDPSKTAEREQRREIVHEAIDRLPPDYRTIVILRDIEELSTAEAAAILDITEGAARVRLHRARNALRSILDAYFK